MDKVFQLVITRDDNGEYDARMCTELDTAEAIQLLCGLVKMMTIESMREELKAAPISTTGFDLFNGFL